jgi:Ras-related protein Rab-6A
MKKLEHEEIKYKLIVIGDENVGKTSIINRFKSNQFIGDYEPTVGLDFQSIPLIIDNQNITLLLYDTAGQEKFRSLIPLYTKDANIILLIYDTTNEESFRNIEKWYESLSNINKEEAIIFLVGNKIDLTEQRKVKEDEAKIFAEGHNYIFQEVSALAGDGIQELFLNKLLSQIRTQLLYKGKIAVDQEEEQLKFNLKANKEKNKKNKKCCPCFSNLIDNIYKLLKL